MMMRSTAWITAISLGTSPLWAADAAQPGPTVEAGDRVRVKVVGDLHLKGKLVSWTADEVVLQGTADRPWRLPMDRVQKVEVYRGSRSRAREGAVAGFVVGAVLVGPTAAGYSCLNESGCSTGAGIGGALVGGLAVGAFGAMVGLAFRKEKWVGVSQPGPRITLAVGPAKRGLGAQVSLAF